MIHVMTGRLVGLILASVALIGSLASPAAAQSIDEIVAKHMAARGGAERWQAIRTLPDGVGYGDLGGTARTFLCIGMIVGRMETLVIIALFNPAFWRR